MKIYKLEKKENDASRINYNEELNQQQKEVVLNSDKATLVLAGPGAGKTRVLVYRVAHLIERGELPASILLLTFTNKAAKEMMRRVEELLGSHPRGLVGGTFHHVGNMILRRHAEALDLSGNFSIIDNEDSKQLLKDIIARIIDDKTKHFPSVNVIKTIISFSFNALISIEECISTKFPNYEKYSKDIKRISEVYLHRKKQSHLVDFDDLLIYWNKLLENEKIKGYYQRTFRHILVDEFQDTNKLQFEIIKKLIGSENSIMAVGDDCQSIYSFRAAEIENILGFPKIFPDYKEYKLESNYRSTPQIMDLINHSIKHNSKQFKKVLVARNKAGNLPAVVRCRSPEQEAHFIGQRILELKDGGTPYNEIGVLFRAEYQSAEVELELMKRGIPFQKRGGLKFFEQAHIKDMTAFLKIISNNKDELAWKRVLCLFKGIGAGRAIKIWDWAKQTHDPLKHVASDNGQILSLDAVGWADFKKLIRGIDSEEKSPSKLIDYLLKNYYEEYLKDNFPNFKERIMDVKQYVNLAAQYKEVGKFLEDIILDADLTGSESGEKEDDEKIILSTIHQAKGLEWSAVFVVSLADERFPLERAYAEDELEEERRLFYVACSRAKKELYLTLPMQEYTYWGGHKVLRDSIFIEELPQRSYEAWMIDEEEKTAAEGKGFVSADEYT